MSRAALILAGGRGRRFQSEGGKWLDKALALLRGKPLLVHAVKNVQGVVDKVVVCVNDETRRAAYAQVLSEYGLADISIVTDIRVDHISGPNVAIMSGLKATKADRCLTVPTDMPFLNREVAEYLFKVSEGFEVAVPIWPNGRLETLLMTLQQPIAFEIAETLCLLKHPRSDDIPRGASKTLLVSPMRHIKHLDPQLASFVNINYQADLTCPKKRPAEGPINENIEENLGVFSSLELQLLKEGAKALQNGDLAAAQKSFCNSAELFEAGGCNFWAALTWEAKGETLLKQKEKETDAKFVLELDSAAKQAYLKAADNYRLEAEFHEVHRCFFLAERALADKAWCESWGMGKHSPAHRYPSKVPKR